MANDVTGTPTSAAGCGAPSVWSGDGRETVLWCIDTAQQCAGTCGEYRQEIFPAAAYHRAAARLDGHRGPIDALVALTARLAAHVPGADGVEVAYRPCTWRRAPCFAPRLPPTKTAMPRPSA